jgi:hypothetical protein
MFCHGGVWAAFGPPYEPVPRSGRFACLADCVIPRRSSGHVGGEMEPSMHVQYLRVPPLYLSC